VDALIEALAYYFFRDPIFGIGNFLLAALMWTMLGRFVLGLFVPADWDFYIWRFFRRVTDPIIELVRVVTPSFMVEALLPLVAVWWLIVARIGWWILCRALGLAPTIDSPF
jgi:uncharacterized protein YggT (Ycf19 family)